MFAALIFNGTWRRGQLPSGQTAKARSDYRVQSLPKDMAATRSIESQDDHSEAQNSYLSGCGRLQSGAKASVGRRVLAGQLRCGPSDCPAELICGDAHLLNMSFRIQS
jgi:hypothetical protein